MRRKSRQSEETQAWALLSQATEHTVATSTAGGAPVLRVLNGVVVDNWIAFHGAIAGEKSDCLGRPAVVSAHRVWADIPSTFTSAEKACPATTYYESVQASGTLQDLTHSTDKARILDALMQKLQPQGGYLPLQQHMDLYQKDLRSVRVFGLQIEQICGKQNLGQDKSAEVVQQVLRGLFARGNPGDCEAIERILANRPDLRPWCHPLSAPANAAAAVAEHSGAQQLDEEAAELRVELLVAADRDCVRAHAELLQDQYWRKGCGLEEMMRAIRGSSAWVGAFLRAPGQPIHERRFVGAARAIADGAWNAQIMDVVVHASWRGRGIGQALMGLLLQHPQVRDCRFQRLGTADAVSFYERFGFQAPEQVPLGFQVHSLLRRGS